jgi:hypothetical protein
MNHHMIAVTRNPNIVFFLTDVPSLWPPAQASCFLSASPSSSSTPRPLQPVYRQLQMRGTTVIADANPPIEDAKL